MNTFVYNNGPLLRRYIAKFKKMKKLFGTAGKHWCKGAESLDKNGNAVPPKSSNAQCWCLAGALSKITKGYGSGSYYDCREILQNDEHLHESRSIVDFNDGDKTKFKDVKSLLDRTIQHLEDKLELFELRKRNKWL